MNTLTLGLVVLLVLGFALLGYAVFSLTAPSPVLENNAQNYQQFISSELSDKCKTPSGYTDEQWQEHLGHHPDRYAECLN